MNPLDFARRRPLRERGGVAKLQERSPPGVNPRAQTWTQLVKRIPGAGVDLIVVLGEDGPMIFLALLGASDPRHRWFLAAAERRRAGIRVVGVQDPDPATRAHLSTTHGLTTSADPVALLDATQPTHVAVSGVDPALTELALERGLHVLALPPVCLEPADLTAAETLAAATGGQLTVVHPWRGHPATATALAMLPRIGQPVLASLILTGAWTRVGLHGVVTDFLDLALHLTGGGTLHPDDPQPDDLDDPELVREWGPRILSATAAGPDDRTALEVRLLTSEGRPEARVQLLCPEGALEWNTRTGQLRSAVGAAAPVTVLCGRPDEATWLLERLRRGELSSDSLTATRFTLSLGL